MMLVLDEYAPDRILIEPSGVGKLSDVILAAVRGALHERHSRPAVPALSTVVDAGKVKHVYEELRRVLPRPD